MSFSKSAATFLSLALLMALAACNPQAAPVDTAADEAAISAAAENWPKAYNDKNADGVVALYTQDARVYPPGKSVISGQAAIREYFAGDIAGSTAQLTVTADE